jgi:hypothetical protein
MCCTLYASHFTTHEKAGNNDGENKLLLNKIYESWEKLLVVERVEGGNEGVREEEEECGFFSQ